MNEKSNIMPNFRLLKKKTNKQKDNSFQSFSKNKRTESIPNLTNEKNKDSYSNSENNSNSLIEKYIQEIHVNFRNQKGKYNKHEIYKNTQNKYILERINYVSFRNKTDNGDLHESINSPYIYQTNPNISDSFPIFHKHTYTHPTIEQLEIKFGKSENNDSFYNLKNRKKENNSMDPSYITPSQNINIYDINENSFNNRAKIDEEFKLNKTENYNNKKLSKSNYSYLSLNSIPKPQKFKKKIPPIPIKKSSETENNCFYLDEVNNKKNSINVYNQNNRYYSTKTVNNADLYKNKRKIFIKKNIADIKNKNYTNRTYSPRYLKNIEKIGIKMTFNTKKKK